MNDPTAAATPATILERLEALDRRVQELDGLRADQIQDCWDAIARHTRQLEAIAKHLQDGAYVL